MEDDSCRQPPFKRGKLLPEKQVRLAQGRQQEEETESAKGQALLQSETVDTTSSWCSTLTPGQRKLWAKLMQQRKPLSPCLDFGQLSDEMISAVCSFLDAPTLVRMQCLNRRYNRLCKRNEAGWDRLCHQLWKDKVHIPPYCHKNMMKAYKESTVDARERHSITTTELCYDPLTQQGTVWSFRFKESAGEEWTRSDSWYQGEPARKLVFLRDGTVKQYVPGSATLESPRFDTTAALEGQDDADNANEDVDNEEEQDPLLPIQVHPHHNNNLLVEPAMSMEWRFLAKPMDLPRRTLGSYIRLTVGGRDVPTYAVRRSPTGNWGFVMESCWGVFASFELPSRRPLSPRQAHRVLRRSTQQGNVWVDAIAHEQDNGEEEERGGDLRASRQERDSALSNENETIAAVEEADPMLPLRDDSFMVITNDVQWREAFLYNVGARILPEGDEAADEFDRAWGGIS